MRIVRVIVINGDGYRLSEFSVIVEAKEEDIITDQEILKRRIALAFIADPGS